MNWDNNCLQIYSQTINAFPKLFNVFTSFNAPPLGFYFIEKNCNPPADQNFSITDFNIIFCCSYFKNCKYKQADNIYSFSTMQQKKVFIS
jgi:hypothetical protein